MFPVDFLWGAASSAFQTEGARKEGDKGVSVADVRSDRAMRSEGIADTSVATDFYHRYEEDIHLMEEAGLNAFRMSLAWTRIIPDGDGEVNERALKHYEQVIDALVEAGIAPIVTLYHFDLPQTLVDRYGGFSSRRCIDAFVRFARVCFERYGDRVARWLTINEQMVLTSLPSMQGIEGNDAHEVQRRSWQAYHNMCVANARVIKLYRSMNLPGRIGPAISYSTYYPASVRPEDVLRAKQLEDLKVFCLCDVHFHGEQPAYLIKYLQEKDLLFDQQAEDGEVLANARPDFLGLNWYTTGVVGAYADGVEIDDERSALMPRRDRNIPGYAQFYLNPYTPYNEWNWNTDPVGLHYALLRMWERYHLPLLITENGLAYRDTLTADGNVHDSYRIDYLAGMVDAIERAINDGVAMDGYCPWSFTDVLSSSNGIEKRYGLVYVERTDNDPGTLRRIPKDSYHWYAKRIATARMEAACGIDICSRGTTDGR